MAPIDPRRTTVAPTTQPVTTGAPAAKKVEAPKNVVTSGPPPDGFSSPSYSPTSVTAPVATVTQTTPVDQARQDAGRVTEAYRNGGAMAASQTMADLVAAHPGDTAYADALIQASQPTLQRISAELADRVVRNDDDSGGNPVTRNTLTALAQVADAASPTGQDVIGNELAKALPNQSDLNQFDDVLSDLADEGRGNALSSAIVKGLTASCKPEALHELDELVIDQVNGARGEYDDAKAKADEMNARLAADLAQFGQGMTPDQIAAYQAEFRAKHKDVYDAERAAADKLAVTLERNRPALEADAISGDHDAANALYDGYATLAKSTTHADDAIRWVSDISQQDLNGNSLLRQIQDARGGDIENKITDEILATAIPNAQAEILGTDRPGNPDEAGRAAFEEMSELLKPLSQSKAFATVPGAITDYLEATRTAVVDRNFQAVGDRLLSSWDDKSKFGKALAIAGVAMSAYGAVDAFANGNYPDAIKKSAGFAKGALEITSGVLNTINAAKPFAANLAEFAARAAPVVGLVVDGIQAWQDGNAIANDPSNAGHYVELLGTAVSLAGDIAKFVPVVGTALGGILGGIGLGIHAIGGVIAAMIDGNEAEEALTNEQVELLGKATGLNPDDARELVKAGGEDLNRMREMGLSPEQIQELARDPNVRLDSMAVAVLGKVAQSYGLEGNDVMDLFRSFNPSDPDNDPTLYQMILALNSPENSRGEVDHDLSAFRDRLSLSLGLSDEGSRILEILNRGDPAKVNYDSLRRTSYDPLRGDGYEVSA